MADRLVQIGSTTPKPRQPRPEWLRIRMATPAEYHRVRKLVEGLSLNTVCEEAKCPNIYECWGRHGTATFMVLGDVCTRRCGFCAVATGRPPAPPDPADRMIYATARATGAPLVTKDQRLREFDPRGTLW